MTDSKDPKTQPDPAGTEPDTEEAEKKFWERFHVEIGTAIDKKVEEFRTTSTSRNGGRTTLPGAIANLFWPAEKPKSL
jgi:hypothetical protein